MFLLVQLELPFFSKAFSNNSLERRKMKNRLLILFTAIEIIFIGTIASQTALIPIASAATFEMKDDNKILEIGIGENVRDSSQSTKVPRGTKYYFVCKEAGATYDFLQIEGSLDAIVSQTNGSRTKIYTFDEPGTYVFNISNAIKSYNDTITVIVEQN